MGSMEGKDGEVQPMSIGLILFGSKLFGDDHFYALYLSGSVASRD